MEDVQEEQRMGASVHGAAQLVVMSYSGHFLFFFPS
jgi:hypothetical protein